SDARVHENSEAIISRMSSASKNIRFGNYYIIPLWVVNADRMPRYKAKAAYPFDIWDCDNDLITDIGVPIDTTMWGEQTKDGHIIVIDTVYDLSWEMSRFKGIQDGMINCSTFNVWDLNGNGVGDPDEGVRWKARGGRGSGFPNIAGLIRPQEIQSGEIRHALAFTFSTNKKDEFYYPACRTDGRYELADAPAEGMRFQLNPQLTDEDFESWGLSPGAKVVARALQRYGMYLCDNGGDMALQLQLLDRKTEVNRKKWDDLSPGLYTSISKIPTAEFRVLDTGKPISGGAADRVTTPLIIPQCGSFRGKVKITMKVNQHWPGAVIRYTLDGSTPMASSLLYKEPFFLRSSKMIKASAFHPNGKDSHVMRAQIFVH
ncbi:MAG TPA: chitobiase/beta-hexosaminidase C-terminal domain-containing protein, partial [Chryseosolibacter sp.]|nr:chitobiase/beta-hexosaminidase C-terminal domain-containing protein [Chryseosolibacter sp.]